MSVEKIQIELARYRDRDGLPTCAKDFRTGEFCPFLRTARMGTVHVCAINHATPLKHRGDTEEGHIVPGTDCLTWKHPTT